MKVTKITHLKNSTDYKVNYDAIEKCPKCNKALAPENLYNMAVYKEDKYDLYTCDFCSGCKSMVITEYSIEPVYDNYGEIKSFRQTSKNGSFPSSFEKEIFDEEIEKMSPQFVKIYNQALQAEKIGLDEIAGLGYRKSVEFLIKDYAIYKNPEKEDEIKNKWMKACIDEYVDNQHIKILAEKSDWIGNDEAHYVKKQEDRDINDMKKFIKAMVYFIGMTLITEDAESMTAK